MTNFKAFRKAPSLKIFLGYSQTLIDEKRGDLMANRQRNIQLKIWVNEEERKLIEQKMAQLPTSQLGAYMRKMAIDGYIIYTDIKNIKQYIRELQTIGKNINQIAKRVNSTTNIYKEDIEEIKARLNEIWQLQRYILSNLR